MEKFKNMEDSFHVMSHEEMADVEGGLLVGLVVVCLLYTSPSPRD